MTIIPYQFEEMEVRFFSVPEVDSFEVVAVDISRVLDVRVDSLLSTVDDDYKKIVAISDRLGRMQDTTVISESGFYQALARSNKQKAKPFQKWVFETVLPSIRRGGAYISPVKKGDHLSEFEVRMSEATIITNFLKGIGVKDGVATQVTLKGVMKLCPDSTPLLGAVAQDLGYVQAEENTPVNPTILATQLSQMLCMPVSAIKVNNKLAELGLQKEVRNKNNKRDGWTLTPKGKEWGEAIPQTIENGGYRKTRYDIRWNPDIANVLVNNWN